MSDFEAKLPLGGTDWRTAMATAIARPEPHAEASSPIIERSNRASIGTRIAQPLLRGTVGLRLASLARIGGYSQLEQMLWLGRLIELPAAVLVTPNGTKLSDARAAIRDLGQFHRQMITGQTPSTKGRISVCDRRNTDF